MSEKPRALLFDDDIETVDITKDTLEDYFDVTWVKTKEELDSTNGCYEQEPLNSLKKKFENLTDEKQVLLLDNSRYLGIMPLTNLLCVILAEKIQKDHKF